MRTYLFNRNQISFNPNKVDAFITNFIDDAVFARIPNQSMKGIGAAYKEYLKARQ